MHSIIRLFAIPALALLIGAPVLAQTTQPQTPATREINLIIQRQQVRFTAPAETQEWRLEIRNQAGELIFDSGPVTNAEIVWPLKNGEGQALASGLYAYTLTVKESGAETAQTRRGHLIVDLAQERDDKTDRLWITSQSSDGVGVNLNSAEATVARSNDTTIAGLRAALAPQPPPVKGSGTINRITKWTAIDEIGDSVIAESSGNIGVGIAAPTTKLQVAGVIHSTTGGVKFPDGSVQTTAASGGVTSVTASAPLASSGGVTPNISLTGVIAIANGGTGSATQNFVDLTTTQTVAGSKTFSNAVNTALQYNINGARVLGNPGTSNLFAGEGAGANNVGAYNAFFGRDAGVSNTTGSTNAFFGALAGFFNDIGGSNSFFGSQAGHKNTSGNSNSFFGRDVGYNNTTGGANSFFGHGAGGNNTTAGNNSFFGAFSGFSNTTGGDNSFFGTGAGANNTTGGANSFFGREAGVSNTTGSANAFFGLGAGFKNTTADGNSFFGVGAGGNNTTGSNNAFFGREAGVGNTLGHSNSFFGFNSGWLNTEGIKNSFIGIYAGYYNTTGGSNTFLGENAGLSNTTESGNSFIGAQSNGAAGISNATALGFGATVTQSDSVVLGNNAAVGIGVSAPKAKLDVRNGNVYLGTAGQGVILKSPDGATCRLLTIDNTGALVLAALTCP